MKHAFLPAIAIFIFSFTSPTQANKSIREWAFIRLNYVRSEKFQQLNRYCDTIHKQAQLAGKDDVMLNFFDVNNKCHAIRQHGSVPDKLEKKLVDFRKQITDYYFQNYICFYDILFINKAGNVLHTIRKELDCKQNIFRGKLSESPLARHLSENPQKEVFIDFHYYEPSDEPAAFFIEPVHIKGEHIGWIVLQCALNKVNSLFAGSEQMGMTGETFLVNKDGFLLTESSFVGESTILEMHLDNKNIKAKFKEKKGNKIVTDYRGFTVLTSFEVFNFLGVQWLVVAKVDEAQAVTEHFEQQDKYYFEQIVNCLSSGLVCTGNVVTPKSDKKIIMVDMDEFVKANHQELLQTVGVSTCTAVIATYPDKFGYMAHLSPLDKMYGGNGTNLLGHIVKKIKNYDIYKFERQRVRFTVIAKHLDSLKNIIDKLVSEGFLLSQINILHYPKAECANVLFNYSNNMTYVEWIMETDTHAKITQGVCDDNNLGVIVKQFIEN